MKKYYKFKNKTYEEDGDNFYEKGLIFKISKGVSKYCIGNTSIFYVIPTNKTEIDENEYNDRCISMLKTEMKSILKDKQMEIMKIKKTFNGEIVKYLD